MSTTRALDRIAVVLEEDGHSAGTARAIAANTVRAWAETGRNHRGQDLPRTVRERAVAEIEALQVEPWMRTVAAAMAGDLQETVARRFRHRATLAEGLLMACDTQLGREKAIEFLGGNGWSRDGVDRIRVALREVAADEKFLAEAMGHRLPLRATSGKKGSFHGLHGHQKAAQKSTKVTAPGAQRCANCKGLVPNPSSACPNCGAQPPTWASDTVAVDAGGNATEVVPVNRLVEATRDGGGSQSVVATSGPAAAKRGGAASGRGGGSGRGGAKPTPTPQQTAATETFEKMHPRKRQGAPGGGQFIQKGEGTGKETPNGSQRVLAMQQRLLQLGYGSVADGRFGPQTELAVKHFQATYGLKPTGKVDAATLATMRTPPPITEQEAKAELAALNPKKGKAGRAGKAASGRGSGGTGAAAGTTAGAAGAASAGKGTGRGRAAKGKTKGLGKGAGSSAPNPQVQQAQQMLDQLGYSLGVAGADGTIGDATLAAVKQFQQRMGLPVDGIIGPQTLAMLKRKLRQQSASDYKDFGVKPTSTASGKLKNPKQTGTRGGRQLRHAAPAEEDEVEVEEASYRNVGIGGSLGTRVTYGGVVPFMIPMLAHIEPGRAPDPMDEGETTEMPPNLRAAETWDMCGNCVHYNTQERCLLHMYPVASRDVCDDHYTLTPVEQRHYSGWLRGVVDMQQAREAGDGSAYARAEARTVFHKERLEEVGFLERLHPRKRAGGPGGGKWVAKPGMEMLHDSAVDEIYKAVQKRHPQAGHVSIGRGKVEVHTTNPADKGAKLIARYPYSLSHEHVPVAGKPGSSLLVQHGHVDFSKAQKRLDRQRARVHRAAAREDRHVYSKPADPRAAGKASRELERRMDRESARHRSGGEPEAVARLRKARTDEQRRKFRKSIEEGEVDLEEVKSSAYPGLDRSPKKNWVDKAGGLPSYIERIAKHLHYEKGKDIGQAIAIAVNVVKKMCASGDTNFPGKQNVNAKSRGEACAAVKSWEAKKLRHGMMREAALQLEREPIPKGAQSLSFAVRTLQEVAEVDMAIAEGTFVPVAER